MEKNITFVQRSESLHEGARALAERAVEMSKLRLAADCDTGTIERAAGRPGRPRRCRRIRMGWKDGRDARALRGSARGKA
jgi:hypothetical protein